MAALAVLAAAAAAVSWDAQYQMVRSVKHAPVIAALEAGIPDVGALIFASLGIALALHAKRALRARMLALAGERHDLARLPLTRVSQIANTIGAEVNLSPGTARRVLLSHVRALQNGHNQPGGAR